jgi:dephospho-CoA kinase
MRHILVGTMTSSDIVMADIPLLFETGVLRPLFTLVVVVACHSNVQYQRLSLRNPDLTEQQCRDRMASQMPMARKVSRADVVVWNDGTLQELRDQVRAVTTDLHERLSTGRFLIFRYLCFVGGIQLALMASGQGG